MVTRANQPFSSSGNVGSTSRYHRMTSVVSAMSYRTGPPMIRPFSPTGWQRKVIEVTIPKLPPPPRSAQNRSAWLSSDAVTNVPSARTTSAASMLSSVIPKLAGQVPDPAAQGQPGDARVGDEARGDGQTERTGGVVEIAERGPGVDADGAVLRVDGGAAHEREVDDQRVVPDAEPARAVPATADREGDVVLAAEPHARQHVRDVPAAGDRRGPLVDHAVVHRTHLVVARVGGHDHLAPERGGELVERGDLGCGHQVSCMRGSGRP